MTTPSPITLRAGALVADVHPSRGMLVTSLRQGDIEWLTLVDEFETALVSGKSIGIPLLHPFANRLSRPDFSFEGRDYRIDTASPLLMRDWNGVIIHGVAWPHLPYEIDAQDDASITAHLDWTREAWLAMFPFPHRVTMQLTLAPDGLTVRVTVAALGDTPVPVSFGFHPYFGLPDAPRAEWRLSTPPMRRRILDELLIPTGRDEAFTMDGPLDGIHFDDGFDLATPTSTFTLSTDRHALHVDLLEGYRFLQIYSPVDQDIISIEPMVAPTDALVTGESLPVARPGQDVTAVFRVRPVVKES